MIEAATFTCSICGEPSSDICVYCTKDACWNHRCERCKGCSDCCECDVPLTAREPQIAEPAPTAEPVMAPESTPEPLLNDEPDSEPIQAPSPDPEPDSSWLAPPEATEEPDLNTPPAPVIERIAEQTAVHEKPEEKTRPFPTNSARDEHERED